MATPITIEDSTFDSKVIKAKKPVLIDFWAEWCKPCKMVSPIIDELAKEYDGRVEFMKMNIDQNQQVAARYNIKSLPTIMLFKEGKPVSHMVGFRSKANLIKTLEDSLD
jgi:thioredoxin 1